LFTIASIQRRCVIRALGHVSLTPLDHPVPQFDVQFSEKFLKILATRGEIFSLKFTKYPLAAGFCPDALGEHFPPHHLATIRGPTSKERSREGRG